MSLSDEFNAQVKTVNWHAGLFSESSLAQILATLNGFEKIGISHSLYKPKKPEDLKNLALAINNLKQNKTDKALKYKKPLEWLETAIPDLKLALIANKPQVVIVARGYHPGKHVSLKDVDGGWHEFELQEKGNSCGCACVGIVLRAHTNIIKKTEQEVQNMMGLVEDKIANTGKTESKHDWNNIGSTVPSIVKVLISYGIRDARAVTGAAIRTELEKSGKNNPAILGWWWGPRFGVHDASNSGHWTACVGRTKDNSRFIILDPWNEIQYIPVATFNQYRVTTGDYGWFDPTNVNDPAVIVTHPK